MSTCVATVISFYFIQQYSVVISRGYESCKAVHKLLVIYMHVPASESGGLEKNRETSINVGIGHLISGSRHWYILGGVVSGKFERIGSL